MRWLAPELLDPDINANCVNTFASDVLAYACVCYEVAFITIAKVLRLTCCMADILWSIATLRNRS